LKKSFLLLLFFVFLIGCRKDKPPVGEYQATFTYDYMDDMEKTYMVEITETSRDEIMINDYPIVKNGKKVKGTIYVTGGGPYHIQGKWSGKFLSRKYKIEGTFIEIVYNSGNTSQYSGTFLITSYF
jgi:hypothetical protein